MYFKKNLFLARQGYYFYFLYALRSPIRRSTLSALRSTLTYGCRPPFDGRDSVPAQQLTVTSCSSEAEISSDNSKKVWISKMITFIT